MKNLLQRYILRYIYTYDPAFFSLIYSLKGMVAIILSVAINYSLFGANALIWATLMPIYIFFLNSLISDKDTKIVYLFWFVLLSSLAVFLFHFVAKFDGGIWLFIPSCMFAFVIGISSFYSKDLQFVLTSVFINALVACIYVFSNFPMSIENEIVTIIIGGISGIFVRFFISFGKYGRFTIRTFHSLFFNLQTMLQYIADESTFANARSTILEQINAIKITLSTESAKIKDPHLVKNLKRALFYLYKIEDICYSLNLLHSYIVRTNDMRNDDFLYDIRNEISYNLSQLSGIFSDKIPQLRTDSLHLLKSDDSNLSSLLAIIYNKIESFNKAANDETNFNVKIERHNAIKWSDLSFGNPNFRYAIKYAFVIAISIFIATHFNLDHGIWIALGAISVIRPNISNIHDAGREYLIGTFGGVMIGFLLVFLFQHSVAFVGIFVFVIFLVLYLKVYPYKLWIGSLGVAFVMMFSLLRDDFVRLIFERLLDATFGLFLVVIVFLTILVNPKDSSVATSLNNILAKLGKLFCSAQNGNLDANKLESLERESDCLRALSEYGSNLAQISKQYNRLYSKDDMEALWDLKVVFESLNDEIVKLCDYMQSVRFDDFVDNELVKNDLKILDLRFCMLCKMLLYQNFFFNTEVENRFLCKDKNFCTMTTSIFDAQNKIYLLLYPMLKRL